MTGASPRPPRRAPAPAPAGDRRSPRPLRRVRARPAGDRGVRAARRAARVGRFPGAPGAGSVAAGARGRDLVRARRAAGATKSAGRRPDGPADMFPDLSEAAPAGWPVDVLRRTGRASAVELLKESGEPAPKPSRRRRLPVHHSPRPSAVREPPPSWPGRLPAPSPATVPPEPLPALLQDAGGAPVRLVRPDALSAPPAQIAVDGSAARRGRRVGGPVAGVGPLVDTGSHAGGADAGRPRRRGGAAAGRPQGPVVGGRDLRLTRDNETAGRFV